MLKLAEIRVIASPGPHGPRLPVRLRSQNAEAPDVTPVDHNRHLVFLASETG